MSKELDDAVRVNVGIPWQAMKGMKAIWVRGIGRLSVRDVQDKALAAWRCALLNRVSMMLSNGVGVASVHDFNDIFNFINVNRFGYSRWWLALFLVGLAWFRRSEILEV